MLRCDIDFEFKSEIIFSILHTTRYKKNIIMVVSDFIDSQKIIYELKPVSKRQTPIPPAGFKEARQLNELEFKKVNEIPFIRLLNGKEPLTNVQIRYELYKKNWNRQLRAISSVLLKTDRFKFRTLKEFLSTKNSGGRLITALLNLGSNISNHDRLLANVCNYLNEDKLNCLVKINPGVFFNIQKIIKRIEDCISYKLYALENNQNNNKKKRNLDDYEQEDEDVGIKNFGDFDLIPHKLEKRSKFEDTEDLLTLFAKRGIKLIILIQNADAMNSQLIEQLLRLLNKYNKISSVSCMIGISTPFIIFQEKISKITTNYLFTKSFTIDNSNDAINQIMEDLLLNINETYNSLIFDPKLVLKFLKMKDFLSIQQFNNYMKLIYMRHYYSQPLSLFWTNDFKKIDLKSIYFEIFKTLPSVIENSNEISSKYLVGIANNEVSVIGELLRKNLNKLINWRFEFRNLIDFLNFFQASLSVNKIWDNNLELFEKFFEKYYELRDHEDNWNEESDAKNKKFRVLNSKINPNILLKFLEPLWYELKNGPSQKSKLFHENLSNDEQYTFITQKEGFPQILDNGSVYRLIKVIKNAVRDQICDLDLDYQSFTEICVIKDDIVNRIHESFEPCIRENSLSILDNSYKILFSSQHWINGNNCLDTKMFYLIEPILCEMYRIFKETGVTVNIFEFYQVFKNSFFRRDEIIKIMKQKLEDKELLEILEKIEMGDENEWSKLTLSWFLKSLTEFENIGILRYGDKNQVIEKNIWRGV